MESPEYTKKKYYYKHYYQIITNKQEIIFTWKMFNYPFNVTICFVFFSNCVSNLFWFEFAKELLFCYQKTCLFFVFIIIISSRMVIIKGHVNVFTEFTL